MWSPWLIALEVPTPVEPRPTPVVELEWRAPAECPTADEVRIAIEAVVGPLGEDPTRSLRVDGFTTHDGSAYALELEVTTRDAVATRRFEAPQCAALLEPVLVVVALAVDLASGTVANEYPSATIDAPPTPPPVPPPVHRDVERPPVTTTRRAPRVRAIVAASTGLDAGHLPGIGAALDATLGLVRGRGRAELGVVHVFARQHDRARGVGGTFVVTDAVARGCFEIQRRRLVAPLCGGIELGSIRGSGRGVADEETANHLWLAFSAGAGIAWLPHPRVAIGARAWLVVAPVRRAFSLAREPLYTTRVIAGRPLVHVEVRLP